MLKFIIQRWGVHRKEAVAQRVANLDGVLVDRGNPLHKQLQEKWIVEFIKLKERKKANPIHKPLTENNNKNTNMTLTIGIPLSD